MVSFIMYHNKGMRIVHIKNRMEHAIICWVTGCMFMFMIDSF